MIKEAGNAANTSSQVFPVLYSSVASSTVTSPQQAIMEFNRDQYKKPSLT